MVSSREEATRARPAIRRAGLFHVHRKEHFMFCCLVRIYRKVKQVIVRAATVLAWRTEQRVRQAWRAHGVRVASNATYAAVTATVLAGVLGLVPVKDVLSAVLGAVLGYASTQRGTGRRMTGSWSDDWT
jgi:hypothetical protein